ncbi:MarR family winged helix-turn-helix transcriptional regulator [Actinoplanes friuliensis]|uniref:Transcriptional regulator, MarR family protein n=1 Tax=Actinoplanes friuliensis DSM 7358 TaxID=1246995 RepID=U5VYR8_9ACTN|nr:MarR family transcriptional regulator [Actinoplanes friuliensis]AGZ40870.1 Transcriptional regulator, MarR family protein [Actinoplanes friuliensis DSM 7358]
MSRDASAIAALEREIAILVRRHQAASVRLSRDSHTDLTDTAYGLLVRLGDHGPHRPTDLAEHIGVGTSTITRQIQPLESLGLVVRVPVPGDGRAHLVALTEEGHHRINEARDARDLRLRDRLSSWPQSDVSTLTGLLARFNGRATGPDEKASQHPATGAR